MIEVIKFGATWCGPCRVIAPTIKTLKDKYDLIENSGVKVTEVDVDEDPDKSSKYGIKSVPTLIFIKDNEVKQTKSGILNEKQIEEIINSL